MGSITFPGLATGIDTAKIIQQLMEVNSRKLKVMQLNLQASEVKRDAITELQSKLTSFKSSVASLKDSSALRSFKAVTSDSDAITAEASSDAYEGNHSVKIKQLASAERWVHEGVSNSTAYVGAGNFIFSYNHKELIVQTTEETTLQDLVGLINNDAENPGVTASILKYDDGSGKPYHLVLSGKDSGSDYQITVNTHNTERWAANTTLLANGENAAVTTKIEDLDGFAGAMESGTTPDQIHITGNRHGQNTPVDFYFDVTQYTTIEDLVTAINEAFKFGGVQTATAGYEDGVLKLTDHTSGVSSMTLAISFVPGTGSSASITLPTLIQDVAGGSVSASLANFAAANFTETQNAKDSQIKVDDYPPGADEWISRSSNTINDVISGVTLHLHNTTYNGATYDSIEVNLTRDTEALKGKINEMITAYNTAVMYIQEKTRFDADGKTRGILSTEYNVMTIWSQMRNPLLAGVNGFGSKDSFTRPSDIGIKIDSDGMLSLDSDAFDKAVVKDYRGVLDLIGTDKTGVSNSGDIKFYNANKYTTAGQYEVRVYGDGAQITSAQIRQVGGTWRDATFNGNIVTGNSTFGSNGNPLYAEHSLQFTVDVSKTSGTPMTAMIYVKQGFAGAAYEVMDDSLNTIDGSLPITKKSLDQAIKYQNERIEEEQKRLEAEQQRLVERFARLEKQLQLIQRQMSSITNMG